MQMLKKIFKSDSKYYLELDEGKKSEVVQTAVKTAEKTAKVVQEKAKEVAKAEPVQEAVKPSSSKPSSAKATSPQTPAKTPTKAPQNSGASSYEPPFWVAAMNQTNMAKSNGKAGEGNFATENLMPTITKYRRLPGGSLAKFRDMAKTAKTPRR